MLARGTAVLWSLVFCWCGYGQASLGRHPLITQAVDENRRVTLRGNTHPQASLDTDRGRVPDEFPVAQLTLQLKRPAELQAGLEAAVREMGDPNSSNFHHWMSAQDLGERFGVAGQDLAAVRRWLEEKGFHVDVTYPSKTAVMFSGTAGMVRRAFHTELHRVQANGEMHIANLSDPSIPSALEPVVMGITSLNDFRPTAMHTPLQAVANETFGTGRYLSPGDLAVIYNVNPVYAQGIGGQGQTIVVLEDSDVYSTGDWDAFRREFGLAKRFPHGSFTQVHPSSNGFPCVAPGVTTDDREATLDAEWATAVAPDASIVLASCRNTFDFGGFIAMRNLLNSATPPPIMSLSYGRGETQVGAAENASIYDLYLQAAAEGVSMFVAAGDWGADGYFQDRALHSTPHGVSVSAYASTPYNVAVGGTDFEDVYFNAVDTYWNTTNTVTWESAKSYVPEIPWDGSCASQLIATYHGFAQGYGSDGFCNSPLATAANALTALAGSGGASSCAHGAPSIPGVVSGTCSGYVKPWWQAIAGNPSDGVRDIPDVALFASAGAWQHGYLICYSDPSNSGVPCTSNFQVSGGTSASTPVMAGIQALINQATGQSWGNPNPVYYALAREQYGSGSAGCDASLGNGVSGDCTFYDITQGDNEVVCQAGEPNCFAPSGALGALSLSETSFQPAFPAGVGWDFATGIGSVNAFNLVSRWSHGVELTGLAIASH